MGQAERRLPEAAALNEAGEGSIGAYLARQRRLRGISLDALSAETRLPRRSLERLEAGAFDGNPDGFARGFVRTVAGALGLDPEATVARMLPEATVAGGRGGAWVARFLHRPLTWAGVTAALLSALGLWLAISDRPGPAAVTTQTEVLYRRDAVRELAESVGAWPPREPAAPESAPR